jgi:hypothetical protein
MNKIIILILIILLSIGNISAKSAYDQLNDIAGNPEINIPDPGEPECVEVSEADRIRYHIASCNDISPKTTSKPIISKPIITPMTQTENQIRYPTLYPTYKIGSIIIDNARGQRFIMISSEHTSFIYHSVLISNGSGLEFTTLYGCDEGFCNKFATMTEDQYIPYRNYDPVTITHEIQKYGYMESILAYEINGREYRQYVVIQAGNFEKLFVAEPQPDTPMLSNEIIYTVLTLCVFVIIACFVAISKRKT